MKAEMNKSFRDLLKAAYKDKLRNLILQKMVRNLDGYIRRVDLNDGFETLNLFKSKLKAVDSSKYANLQRIILCQRAKERDGIKRMIFSDFSHLGVGAALLKNLDSITNLSQNNGLKQVLEVARKFKSDSPNDGRVKGNVNILKNLRGLELRRKQSGFRKIKELYLFLLWKLTDKCMNR